MLFGRISETLFGCFYGYWRSYGFLKNMISLFNANSPHIFIFNWFFFHSFDTRVSNFFAGKIPSLKILNGTLSLLKTLRNSNFHFSYHSESDLTEKSWKQDNQTVVLCLLPSANQNSTPNQQLLRFRFFIYFARQPTEKKMLLLVILLFCYLVVDSPKLKYIRKTIIHFIFLEYPLIFSTIKLMA